MIACPTNSNGIGRSSIDCRNGVAPGIVQRNDHAFALLGDAFIENDFSGALDVRDGLLGSFLDDDRHGLALGIEGNFPEDRMRFFGEVDFGFHCSDEQRALGGVADDLPTLGAVAGGHAAGVVAAGAGG